MKLNPKFLTHTSKGDYYMVSAGNTKFSGMVKSNETAAFIIECLKKETSEKEIVDKLVAEYANADRKTVEKDVADIIAKLRKIDAIV